MGADASCVVRGGASHPDESALLGCPAPRRWPEPLLSRFPDLPQVGTIEDLFQHTREVAPDDDFYGMRDYAGGAWQPTWSYISRRQLAARRNAVGSFLLSLGARPGAHVGIMSHSRVEWVLAQFACYGYGLVPTPVYDTLGWDKVNHVVRLAGLRAMFVVSTKVDALLANLADGAPLADVIVIDQEDAPYDFAAAPARGPRLHALADALAFAPAAPNTPPRPDAPAFLMFTSGTTSAPKGCVITHANAIALAASVVAWSYPFSSADAELVYLPLAHIFEVTMQVVGMKVFGRLGFYSGSIPRLAEEFRLFRPTVITGVTRVYERLKEHIESTVAAKGWAARAVFRSAVAAKSFLTHTCRVRRAPLLDRVFEPVRRQFGGRLRLFVAGGAALPPDVQAFLRVACNAGFIQGYGLTETCCGCLAQTWDDVGLDSCGTPMPWAEVKLRSTECHSVANNTGELLVRGPAVFAGYYKDEEGTRAVFDENGFFCTGDIFELTPTRQLRMISRIKDLVKLAQGEYVSLPKLTALYSNAVGAYQVFVYAGLKSRFLGAIVVVTPENAGRQKAEFIAEFDRIASESKLQGFERIKDVYVTTEAFTVDNGMLTPSLKASRFEIERRFARQLQALQCQ
jgi:long-chain acyl-CoA synthetase